jgi:CRISPR-associated endonuclease Cas1
VAQYKAYLDERAYEIAKSIVNAKIESQNIILRKHRFEPPNPEYVERIDKITGKNLESFQRKIKGVEGKNTQQYLELMFSLIPEKIRPDGRQGFMAYDGTNNLFNLAYEILAWKVHRALIKAHLEPYLGFLHTSAQSGTLSLVCDFQELYRGNVDDFVIGYLQNVKNRDFITKTRLRIGCGRVSGSILMTRILAISCVS